MTIIKVVAVECRAVEFAYFCQNATVYSIPE